MKVVQISIFCQYSQNTWRTELVYDTKKKLHLKLSAPQIQNYIDNGAVIDVNTANFPDGKQKKTTQAPIQTPPVQPTKTDSVSSTENKVQDVTVITPTVTQTPTPPKKKPIQIGVSDTAKVSDR